MPNYQYRCGGCQHLFELFLGMKENPLVLCPLCEDKAFRVLTEAPKVSSSQSVQEAASSADTKGNEEEAKASTLGCGCVLTRCSHLFNPVDPVKSQSE